MIGANCAKIFDLSTFGFWIEIDSAADHIVTPFPLQHRQKRELLPCRNSGCFSCFSLIDWKFKNSGIGTVVIIFVWYAGFFKNVTDMGCIADSHSADRNKDLKWIHFRLIDLFDMIIKIRRKQ